MVSLLLHALSELYEISCIDLINSFTFVKRVYCTPGERVWDYSAAAIESTWQGQILFKVSFLASLVTFFIMVCPNYNELLFNWVTFGFGW